MEGLAEALEKVRIQDLVKGGPGPEAESCQRSEASNLRLGS